MIYHVESFEHEKPPHFRSTNDALVVTTVSIALENVGSTHNVLVWHISSKTDSKTNDTLVSTSISIVLQKIGLMIHLY